MYVGMEWNLLPLSDLSSVIILLPLDFNPANVGYSAFFLSLLHTSPPRDATSLASKLIDKTMTLANGASETPSEWVTLVSNDGFEFHIRRSAACISGTLRRMLDTQSEMAFNCTIFFLLILCRWLHGSADRCLSTGKYQWHRLEQGGRVFLLQREEQRSYRCTGHGNTIGAVSGALDGGGLSRYLKLWGAPLQIHLCSFGLIRV